MHSEPIPVACSLDDRTAATQLTEWADLQAQVTGRAAIPGGVQLTFPASLHAVVSDLARREQSCCAFLDIEVTASTTEVVLRITAKNPDAMPVIDILAGM